MSEENQEQYVWNIVRNVLKYSDFEVAKSIQPNYYQMQEKDPPAWNVEVGDLAQPIFGQVHFSVVAPDEDAAINEVLSISSEPLPEGYGFLLVVESVRSLRVV